MFIDLDGDFKLYYCVTDFLGMDHILMFLLPVEKENETKAVSISVKNGCL